MRESKGNEPDGSSPIGQHFVVLGGGIAGLTTARELLRKGCQVTLLESGSELGGLARTFEREGFRFDFGGHRFHSNNPSVVWWLEDLLGDDLLTVPRRSRIHLEGQFVDYPIRFPGALSIFSPIRAAGMLGSFLAARITERNRADVSFEDWVVRRYGRALYEVFFKPYTEKVWGIPCHALSAQWASQRIGIPSMWRAIHHAIRPPKEPAPTAISQFYYPRQGFGMIATALARDIKVLGGRVLLRTRPTRIDPDSNGTTVTVQSTDGAVEVLQADHVVSTIPLEHLLGVLPAPPGSGDALNDCELDYRDLICLFLAIRTERVSEDSWTYFPQKELMFGRTHEPRNWSSEMVSEPGFTSLAVEIFASRGEATWKMSDEEVVELVTSQMEEIGWVRRTDIHRSWVVRIPYAYPIYRVGYEQKLQRVLDYLGQWKSLHLVGRTGSFRYMNSDAVVEDVFRFMSGLFPDEPAAVDGLLAEEGRWV